MQFGIAAIGGYLPLLRLDRKAAKELAWTGLGMPRSGHRTVSDWDEDALTMAVEAARGLAAQPELGTIGIDGRMYDIPHLKPAHKTLVSAAWLLWRGPDLFRRIRPSSTGFSP